MFTRQCDKHRHSWVVVVGTTDEYATLDQFLEQRLFNIDVVEENGGGGSSSRNLQYRIAVTDPSPLGGRVEYCYPQ